MDIYDISVAQINLWFFYSVDEDKRGRNQDGNKANKSRKEQAENS